MKRDPRPSGNSEMRSSAKSAVLPKWQNLTEGTHSTLQWKSRRGGRSQVLTAFTPIG